MIDYFGFRAGILLQSAMFVSATFMIALLLPTAVAPSRCESQQSGEFDHHYQKRMMSHGENLGELYYQHQLKERGRSLAYNSFIHLNPNYPCLHGVVPIGADTEESIMDGHKFACGIHHIKTGPIVYSFGSNQQQDFEMSMLQYRPDSIVFTHDILESHLPIPAERISNITYVASALGASSNKKDKTKYYLLHELMKERGHKYIDVLKIDIEGGEFVWLDNEPEETFSRIGQLMIEVHRSRSGKCSLCSNKMQCICLQL